MVRPDREASVAVLPTLPVQAHLVSLDPDTLAGLARWLAGRGVEVTGPAPSASHRHRTHAGHDPASTPRSGRWLVYSSDVPGVHSDRLVARREGVAERSYPAILREILRRGTGIAVAGRRQGRVAAAMIAWTLAQSGLDPTVLLRGGVPQLDGLAASGHGVHSVVDVTETLDEVMAEPPGPGIAVLLDVEAAGLVAGVARVLACLGPAGYLLGSPAIALAAKGHEGRVESFSLDRGSSWRGADLREDRGRFRFRVFHRGRYASEIRLQIPGRTSVLGAVAAVAACRRVEIPTREIKQALEDFEGVSRGFQSRGSYRGVTLLDDDAVEPADVADALGLARAIYGRRRISVVFAPVGPPRADTAAALETASRVLVLDASVRPGDWADLLGASGVASRNVANLDEALTDLDRHLEPGDVLLTLGAGDVGTIADAFLRRLPRDRQGR